MMDVFLHSMGLMHTLRRRGRIVFGAFVLGAAGYALWAYLGPRDFRATATVQGFGFRQSGAAGTAGASPASNYEDIRASLRLLESGNVTERVATAIRETAEKQFLAPFTGWGAPKTVGQALVAGRSARLVPDSTMIEVIFAHPDAAMAAKAANLYAEEFVKLSKETNDAQMAKLRVNLQAPQEKQRLVVEDIQGRMNTLVVRYGLSNLDADNDTVYLAAIQEMQQLVARDKAAMEAAQLRWQQIVQQQQAGKPLWELKAIATQPTVATLLNAYSEALNQVNVVMNRGYPEGSGEVAFARQRVVAAGDELGGAAASAARVFGNEALTAQANYEQTLKRLAEKQLEAQNFAQVRTAYNALRKERDTAENLYQTQMLGAQKQEMEFNLGLPQFTLLQAAEVPVFKEAPEGKPVLWTSLGVGAGCSLILYVGMAIFRPVPSAEREEYERRRKRHSHFDPRERRSRRRSSSSSSS